MTGKPPRRVAAALKGLALAACVVAAPAAASRHTSSATTIHRYTPFAGAQIAPGVKVAHTVRGSCSSPSSEDRRSDAYQCTFGRYIADPCFTDNAAALNYVLCPLLPPAKVERINLTQPLPHNSFPARATGYPWAVQTSEGVWCYRYVGPRYPVLQFTISYLCPFKPYGYLLDKPRRGTTWTALFAPGLKVVNRPPGSYRRVNIASAWW